MAAKYKDIEDYIAHIPEDRIEAFMKLKDTVTENLPEGFEECLMYNMVGYVVPHTTYPDGYHCDPKLPLPFINLANQKGFIALYHSGLYADAALYDWFVAEYPNHAKYKINMGKSCVRFKRVDDIPYDLIAQLIKKMTPSDWIDLYETNVKS